MSSVSAARKTERGFAIYGEFKDTRGCEIRVQESSADPLVYCWVFCHNTSGAYTKALDAAVSAHLNVEQAKELIAALQAFVKDKSDV